MNVDIETTDVERLLRRAHQAISGPSLMAFLREDVSDSLREDIEARFNEEGDMRTGFWKPLSPATVAIRESMGYDGEGPINRRSGDLQNFLQDSRDFSGGANWAQMDLPGSNSDPSLQQKLTTAQKGRKDNPIPGFGPTPARPILVDANAMDLEKVLTKLEYHIVDFIQGSVA